MATRSSAGNAGGGWKWGWRPPMASTSVRSEPQAARSAMAPVSAKSISRES